MVTYQQVKEKVKEKVKEATIEDLYKVEGKAEIVNGKVVTMPPTGDDPGRASGSVYISLRKHERETQTGRAIPDNVAFSVNLPNRKAFSPDAAFFTGKPSRL